MAAGRKSSEFLSSFDGNLERIRAIATHRDIFAQFYTEYFGIIYAIFLKKFENEALAEEFAMDELLRIRSKVNSYQEMGRFTGWIMTVVTRDSLNVLRDEKKREAPLIAWNDLDSDSFIEQIADTMSLNPERAYLSQEMMEILKKLLLELTPGERELLLIRYGEDKGPTEISELFKVRLGVIKTKLHRAVKKLRRKWE